MNVDEFESERSRLTSIAGRILGSHRDADDVVQEAWLRLARAESVDDPPAWLTTVVTRLSIDRLRKERTRTTAETAGRVTTDTAPDDPEADALLANDIGAAMQVVVDALVPAERAAFVLHDVFSYPFAEVAAILGRSDAAVRQLASRARRKLQGAADSTSDRAAADDRDRIVDSFLAAARGAAMADLLALVAPDAVMRADLVAQRMGSERAYEGAAAVAARFHGTKGATPVMIDGELGAAWLVNDTAKVAFLFHVDDGLVRAVELIADPDVLATMEIVALAPP